MSHVFLLYRVFNILHFSLITRRNVLCVDHYMCPILARQLRAFTLKKYCIMQGFLLLSEGELTSLMGIEVKNLTRYAFLKDENKDIGSA